MESTRTPSDAAPAAPPADEDRFRAVARNVALRSAILQGGIVLIAVTMIAFGIRWMLGSQPAQASWAIQVMLGVVTVAGICWGARQRYKLWTLPVRQLSAIADAVRKGELPIDELEQVKGVPGVLVPVVRDLLLELRRQKQQIQQIEREINQRVANRTDALERALGSLREKAARDAMTGLYNRRMLDESLPKLVDRCVAERTPLSLLMIDVDYFKQLNDTLGHAAGDELLRSIGQIIRSTARTGDLAFRAGGDEFVVALPGATADAAQVLADRLGSLVEALTKTYRLPNKPRLSIGAAQLGDGIATAAELLERADQSLYAVKGERKRGERERANRAISA